MAEVAAPGHHTRHASSIGQMASSDGPVISMVPNPDFSFPIQRRALATNSSDSSRRPASSSMRIDIPPPDVPSTHRRAASTLPNFTFNSADTTGLTESEERPYTPQENATTTPPRRGHRRGGSEFVGGDSRFGVSNAMSWSPAKNNAVAEGGELVAAPPTTRRGHAHRRSAAISTHDVGRLMQPPTETLPRLSSSLPNTPLESPSGIGASTTSTESSDPFGPPLDNTAARPPSRPRVGFADNVEYIPRPLSTISSETESSISTIRGHSLNNSISSVLSLGTPSPPSSRAPRIPALSTAIEDESNSRPKSSLEITRRVEREGQWLKHSSSESLKRPVSESAMVYPKTSFAVPDGPARPRKRSFSHALGLDRRRSDPLLGGCPVEPSRLSTISLQEQYASQDARESRNAERKSSSQRFKEWATSMIPKRAKDGHRVPAATSKATLARPNSAGNFTTLEPLYTDAPIAETDLDAVFRSQETPSDLRRPITPLQFETPAANDSLTFKPHEYDDTVLDLDAALGPFKTPPIGCQKQRKELHSDRLTRDFNNPGGHYHRRSESAPNLAPFDTNRDGMTSHPEMADVFEEDEEDNGAAPAPQRPASQRSVQEEEASMGVQIVDMDTGEVSNDGLGIRGDWEPDRPYTAYSNARSILSSIGTERRGSSIMEETIVEEPVPENVEIVEADEEPRASSLTKSSDSSDTPTVIALPTGTLTLPDGQRSLMTPDTHQTSAFSSPAFRQGSFDASRLDTAASSMTDNRTTSSWATGEYGQDLRVSVDVPSLTSSRSTMISTMAGNNSRRDLRNSARTPSASSRVLDETAAEERQRKRGSIQSLSQLVGFKPKGSDELRPQTAAMSLAVDPPKKKEHRLKKLMFWKSKQDSGQAARTNS